MRMEGRLSEACGTAIAIVPVGIWNRRLSKGEAPMRTATMIVSLILLSGCAGTGNHQKTLPTKKTELLPPVTMERTTPDKAKTADSAPFVHPGSLAIEPAVTELDAEDAGRK
jgi:hypothetical protein